MAHHRIAHPQDVPGCFGCKVLGIGYDGKHLTQKTRHPGTPESLPAETTEHRSGRQDVTVHAPLISASTRVREVR